jgi:hypothetical protein
MTDIKDREAILADYDVDESGRIKSPGKFESEMIYVPYFWQLTLEDSADEEQWDEVERVTYIFNFNERSVDDDANLFEVFPELKGVKRIELVEDSQGFVHCVVVMDYIDVADDAQKAAPMYKDLDDFTKAYVYAIAFTNGGEAVNSTTIGNIFDRHFGRDTKLKVVEDCTKFQRENEDVLREACKSGEYNMMNAGHDFWLTRNGHGAGFWDGDLPDALGDKLADEAHAYGVQSPYEGDDHLLYFYEG